MANPFEKIFKSETPLEADRKERERADAAEAKRIDESLKNKEAAKEAKRDAESKRVSANTKEAEEAAKTDVAEKKSRAKEEASFQKKEDKARVDAANAEAAKNQAITNAADAKAALTTAERNLADLETKRADAEREEAARKAEAERAQQEADRLAAEKAKAEKEVADRKAEHEEAVKKEVRLTDSALKAAAKRDVSSKKVSLDAASRSLATITPKEAAAAILANNKNSELQNASIALSELKKKEAGAKKIKEGASKDMAKATKAEADKTKQAGEAETNLRNVEAEKVRRAEQKEYEVLSKKLEQESIYSFESFKARRTGAFKGTEAEKQAKARQYALDELGISETATNAQIEEALREEFNLETKEVEASKQKLLSSTSEFRLTEGGFYGNNLRGLRAKERARYDNTNIIINTHGLDPATTYPEAMEWLRQSHLKDLQEDYRKRGNFTVSLKKDMPLNEIFDVREENQSDIKRKYILKSQADKAQAEQEALTGPLAPLTGDLKTEVEAMTGTMAKDAEKELESEEAKKTLRQIELKREQAKEKLAKFQAEKALDTLGETGKGSLEIFLADVRQKLLLAYPNLPKDISFEEIDRRNHLDNKHPDYIDINKIKNLPEQEGGVADELKAAEGGRSSPDIAASAAEAAGAAKTEPKPAEAPAPKAADGAHAAPGSVGHAAGHAPAPKMPEWTEPEYEFDFDKPGVDFKQVVRETLTKFRQSPLKSELAELKIDPSKAKEEQLATLFMKTKNKKLKELRELMIKKGKIKMDGSMSHEAIAKAFLREMQKPGGEKYDVTRSFWSRVKDSVFTEAVTGARPGVKVVDKALKQVLGGAEKQAKTSLAQVVRQSEDKLLRDPAVDMNIMFREAINKVGSSQGFQAEGLRDNAAKVVDIVVNKTPEGNK